MRRMLFASILIAIVTAAGVGILWFFAGGTQSNADASAELARLSKAGEELNFYARYEGTHGDDPNSLSWIKLYNKPGVGFRFDLPDSVELSLYDAKQDNEILKGGDILIERFSPQRSIISCRTERQSCRTADGLELFAILSFAGLFTYDQPFFAQPHTVTEGDNISAVGETARCFVIAQRIGTNDENATAERTGGFVPGAGLPKTFCYADDGLPLGGLVSDTPPNTNWLKAVEIRREVDTAVFDPPFPLVPSLYDRTPAAEGSPQTSP